jgi:hypothetical protein
LLLVAARKCQQAGNQCAKRCPSDVQIPPTGLEARSCPKDLSSRYIYAEVHSPR